MLKYNAREEQIHMLFGVGRINAKQRDQMIADLHNETPYNREQEEEKAVADAQALRMFAGKRVFVKNRKPQCRPCNGPSIPRALRK